MKVILKTATKTARGRNKTIVYGVHDFAVGDILVALDAEGLCWLGINCGEKTLRKNWAGAELVEDKAATKKIAQEIAKLWSGKKLENLSVPLVLYGTAFQLKVWKELLKIKSGKTTTYQAIAQKIGKPKAVRAVGSAVGRNTVSVVVPCHRVVNKTGSRVNYAWGPEIKKELLKREGAL